jgi:5'-methylthioadenosine phosphorylase
MISDGKIAVIGGSGVYNFEGIKHLNELEIDTPYGKPSDNILELEIDSHPFFFIARHGRGHRYTPTEVNYAANIYALKKLGVRYIVSISAVGSLKDEHAPGDYVLPNQFIDWTKGYRRRTFFGDGVVGHVSVADPIELKLQERIYEIAKGLDCKTHKGGTYLCIEGPTFSTRVESQFYRSLNANVIGMTNVPEAYLAKEAGIAYSTIAMITDYDGWKEEHCTVDEIMKVMKGNYQNAQELLKNLIPSLNTHKVEYEPENQMAVMTNPELISKEKKEIIDVIIN